MLNLRVGEICWVKLNDGNHPVVDFKEDIYFRIEIINFIGKTLPLIE